MAIAILIEKEEEAAVVERFYETTVENYSYTTVPIHFM